MIAKIEESVNLELAQVQPVNIPVLEQNKIRLDVLRLDKIHPIISGNKWFKLKYSLQQALLQKKKSIVTIGGAYSNHILATACACRNIGMQSIGIIRGEKPQHLSCTLIAAIDQGMELEFLPRSVFMNKDRLYALINEKYRESYLVEEGGRNLNGIHGASEILELVDKDQYSFVCCSVGSGTMMAGITRSSGSLQKIKGFSSLKISYKENELSAFLAEHLPARENYEIMYDYHFGGYAKYDKSLINFMNEFFIATSIPTDFVYTAKLFYGVLDLIKKSYFPKGSYILAIHSGGLQGNCSLPPGALLF